MMELVFSTTSYQTDEDHATELSTVGHIVSEQRKQTWVEARDSMSNFEIYLLLFCETKYTILEIFSQHGLRQCR